MRAPPFGVRLTHRRAASMSTVWKILLSRVRSGSSRLARLSVVSRVAFPTVQQVWSQLPSPNRLRHSEPPRVVAGTAPQLRKSSPKGCAGSIASPIWVVRQIPLQNSRHGSPNQEDSRLWRGFMKSAALALIASGRRNDGHPQPCGAGGLSHKAAPGA